MCSAKTLALYSVVPDILDLLLLLVQVIVHNVFGGKEMNVNLKGEVFVNDFILH